MDADNRVILNCGGIRQEFLRKYATLEIINKYSVHWYRW